MRFPILIVLVFVMQSLFAQTEKELVSKVEKATVFFNGAQLDRSISTDIAKGTTVLKFVDLSPYIDKKSVVVKGSDKFKILSVQHQSNYMKELASSEKVKLLEAQLEKLAIQISDVSTEIDVLKEKISFLKNNQHVVSKETGITPAHLKEITAYYASEMLSTKKTISKNKRAKSKFNQERNKLNRQLSSLKAKNKLPSSEVLVAVSSSTPQKIKVAISYFVSQAGWVPSYDVRVMDTKKPLEVMHKANIWQNTGVKWESVKLTLSNANPFKSGQLKELNPHYLAFQMPKVYNTSAKGYLQQNQIMLDDDEFYAENEMEQNISGGKLQKKRSKEIRIRGASSINKAQDPLYVVDGVPMKSASHIPQSQISDMKVLKGSQATALYGSRAGNGVIVVSTKLKTTSSSLANVTNDTKVEFAIKTPYSIETGAKRITVEMKTDKVPANYIYKAVPKVEEEAFLFARIPDWEQVGLLSGDMNLYVGSTYVGQSKLDVRAVMDTLDISVGREKNIILKRENQNDFNSNQLIGSKRKEQRSWEISIRNLKAEEVEVDLFDQIPVSTEKSIDVERLEISGAIINEITGELKWKIKLKPRETKKFVVRYSVKYPKDKMINVD